eukprot:TRINITY_DN7797_c0_g1_i1.p1 TRINITY_DN7797_c0_g1~~TRINITY_DN7797_c0_g1_i1.p1  ORF type:complete len:413 (+),score=54.03 TRINITY_DN7797_c0_g1_i1:149-1240(+)
MEKFQSSSFYVLMLASLFIMFPLVQCLQAAFDASFDKMSTTRTTYFFRVVVTQMFIAFVILGWMFAPQTRAAVLLIGALLGFFSGAGMSSSAQLGAAMDPKSLFYSEVGNQVGSLLPVFVFPLLGFQPMSTVERLRLVLSTPLILIVCISFIVSYFHFGLDLFSKAYRRLSYDIENEDGSFPRQTTETTPMLTQKGAEVGPAASDLERWVTLWCASLGVGGFVTFYVLSMIPLVGSAEDAQSLSLAKCIGEFLGTFFVIAFQQLDGGPFHVTVLLITCVRVALFFYLMYGLLYLKGPAMNAIYDVAWILFNALFSYHRTVVAVQTAAHAEVRNRKAVARMCFGARFGGIFLGMIAAFFTFYLL